jgi:hypothetical protein
MEEVERSSSVPVAYPAVRFYENDRSLARIVAEFLHEGFDRGHPGIVVATAGQRAEILRELRDRSRDVAALKRSYDLVLLDAEEMLSTFMVQGKPDARKFTDQMCEVIRNACRERTNCTVRIFGQTVDVLWRRGEHDAAVRLEVLWSQLAQTEAFSLLCCYAIGSFYKDARFKDVRGQHSHIVLAEGKGKPVGSAASDNNRPTLERPT